MFTGLVKETGALVNMVKGNVRGQLTFSAKQVLKDVQVGDSIAVNGVCLTVTSHTQGSFTVDVMPETLRYSNLGALRVGSPVNIEPALAAGERFGGHIVSGHIDTIARIIRLREEGNATWIYLDVDEAYHKYIIAKGSVAVDGTSLTVAQLTSEGFAVSIIPLTKDETTLLMKKPGDLVNIECDVVGKYVESLLKPRTQIEKSNKINIQFLQENGFV